MFSKKNHEDELNLLMQSSVTLIGKGTNITGNITCKSDIRIEGSVKGNIRSNSKIVIGETGEVEGDIGSLNADISGFLKGKLSAGELLFLKPSAKIYGDIKAAKIVIEAGAMFTGNCDMGQSTDTNEPKLKNDQEKKRPGEKDQR